MQSLFLSDVELGKKDDDHKTAPGGVAGLRMLWANARVHPRKFLKRIVLAALSCIVLYTFIHNIPTDVGIRDRRHPIYSRTGKAPTRAQAQAQAQAAWGRSNSRDAVGDGNVEDQSAYTYNGHVSLDRLLPSLRTLSSSRGSYAVNENVLFVAASLKSVSALLPIACEMGSALRVRVQFALVGRSEIDVEKLLQMNGIDETCYITFHDARPEYAPISTKSRIEKSLELAFKYVEAYMHPQAIVMDGSLNEELFLASALQAYEKRTGAALIELPEDSSHLGWLTRLDAASLSNWNKISIDILIHAFPGASGSLIRLLRSLSRADFGSQAVPHLTIELPQDIDPPTTDFLATFQWPPANELGVPQPRQLSLRHRLGRHGASERDSSVRFLESFWPTDPTNSHVLVLSPQAELSEDFFHYVKYALLEYRYSGNALSHKMDKRLFGISLDLPTTTLDGTTKLAAPALTPATAGSSSKYPTPFLWQAPNSNAALFLGQRWVDLHKFVAQLLETQQRAPSSQTADTDGELSVKLVNKRFPSWLEYALQLCRAHGLWTLYPSESIAGALATIHNELYRPPEEYEKDLTNAAEDSASSGDSLSVGGVADTEEASQEAGATLQDALSDAGGLPAFSKMPLFMWDGSQSDLRELDAQALAFADKFRRSAGGCTAAESEAATLGTLFCQ